jgi:hypothetical protein
VKTKPSETKHILFSSLLIRLLAGIIIATSLFLVIRFATNVPIHDDFGQQFNTVQRVLDGQGAELLFSQHNEHRLLTTNIIPVSTFLLFGWIDMRASIFVGWVFLLLLFVQLTRLLPESDRRSFGPLLIALPLFTPFGFNLIWAGGSLQYFAVIFLGIAAISSLRHTSPFAFTLSCMSAFLSAFSMISGLLATIPALAFLWINFKQRPRWQPIVYTLFAGLLWAGYMYGYTKPGHHPSPTIAFQHPLFALKYYLLFSANFLSGVVKFQWLHIVSAGFHLVLILLIVTRRKWADFRQIWWYILLFIILSSFAITAGRVGFLNLHQAVSARYQIYSACFWATGFLLLFQFRMFPRWLQFLFLILLTSAFLLKSRHAFNEFKNHKEKIENGLTVFLSRGDASGLMLSSTTVAAKLIKNGMTDGYYHPPKSVRLSLETSDLPSAAVFPNHTDLQALPTVNTIEPMLLESVRISRKQVKGYIDDLIDLSNPTTPGIQGPLGIKGWMAVNPQEGQLCEEVLIALTKGPDETPVFFPTAPYQRPGLASTFNQPIMSSAGFRGRLNVSSLRGTYTLSAACRISDSLFIDPRTDKRIKINPIPSR